MEVRITVAVILEAQGSRVIPLVIIWVIVIGVAGVWLHRTGGIARTILQHCSLQGLLRNGRGGMRWTPVIIILGHRARASCWRYPRHVEWVSPGRDEFVADGMGQWYLCHEECRAQANEQSQPHEEAASRTAGTLVFLVEQRLRKTLLQHRLGGVWLWKW